MQPSMCKVPQENAYAERVQDTIKNYYLIDIPLEGKNLRKISNHILKLYNEERPHKKLHKMTPIGFENSVEKLPIQERPKEVIYKWVH